MINMTLLVPIFLEILSFNLGPCIPAHNELVAPIKQFIERQFANRKPLRTNLLIPTLEYRITQAAKLRGALAQMVHALS